MSHDEKTITTVPFLVGLSFGEANTINIVLQNLTEDTIRLNVKVEQCPEGDDPYAFAPVFPDAEQEKIILNQPVTLGPMTCTVISPAMVTCKIYRVTVTGHVEEKGKEVEVSFIGGSRVGNGPAADIDRSFFIQ